MNVNQGSITADARIIMKAEMLRQIWRLQTITADKWERAVFEALTAKKREDLDLDGQEDSHAYYRWISSFDILVGELVEDGYVREISQKSGRLFMSTESDPSLFC